MRAFRGSRRGAAHRRRGPARRAGARDRRSVGRGARLGAGRPRRLRDRRRLAPAARPHHRAERERRHPAGATAPRGAGWPVPRAGAGVNPASRRSPPGGANSPLFGFVSPPLPRRNAGPRRRRWGMATAARAGGETRRPAWIVQGVTSGQVQLSENERALEPARDRRHAVRVAGVCARVGTTGIYFMVTYRASARAPVLAGNPHGAIGTCLDISWATPACSRAGSILRGQEEQIGRSQAVPYAPGGVFSCQDDCTPARSATTSVTPACSDEWQKNGAGAQEGFDYSAKSQAQFLPLWSTRPRHRCYGRACTPASHIIGLP